MPEGPDIAAPPFPSWLSPALLVSQSGAGAQLAGKDGAGAAEILREVVHYAILRTTEEPGSASLELLRLSFCLTRSTTL